MSDKKSEASLHHDLDVMENPKKRFCSENTNRRSWSLLERSTDQEVLQEMGVSILESDEEASCGPSSSGLAQKTTKNVQDIENVNPNVNSVTSPRSRFSPKSPKRKASPNAGPSKAKTTTPKSSEKLKPLQETEQHILETSLVDDYLIEEETPLGQSVSAGYMPTAGATYSAGSDSSGGRQSCTPLGMEDDLILERRSKSEPTETEGDSFRLLSDEMMLSIFNWLPKRSLAHCMVVCKRWYRVACDETLWVRMDLGNKTIAKDALGRILDRKPVILRLASSEIGDWTPTGELPPSRLQFLDLSMATISTATLDTLLSCCPNLKKLSLESIQIEDNTLRIIGQCTNLETLNLTMAFGLKTEGFNSLFEGCTNLLALNLGWCGISEESLNALVEKAPERLQRLNLGGVRTLTDNLLDRLVERCSRLLELDVSDCGLLTINSISSFMKLQRLEHLAVNRCYSIPVNSLTRLSRMPHLQYLDVWGLLQNHCLASFRATMPHITVNAFMFRDDAYWSTRRGCPVCLAQQPCLSTYCYVIIVKIAFFHR
ncbi:S-phase kinase-associated protein 2 isoform X2 [Spodoptera litura]|uniref:S-phase kinase-associated protein 2 isoform X2 n=1 Tax=Spodoptera litura TaxID=69820 RepID=A0A9J7EM60_SPOLT|nr:S-phase kinase-associated protein 2 isoform X2 [Spodoptera litura]